MEQVKGKRRAILDATLRLIARNGFHGTSMSKVAQEAKVSVGNIYNYFDSKDELIDELYKTVKRKSAQAVLANFDRDQPVEKQVRQILGSIIRYAVWYPQEVSFVEQYIRSPYYHHSIDDEISEYYRPIAECFERARQEMLIKDFPQDVIDILTLDVATALAQKQTAGQLTLTDKLIAQVIDTSWEAIRQ
jgi:AcrR family transcriptional regulator